MPMQFFERKDPESTDITDWDLDQLVAYRRKLAKRANQRIVRIEQAGYNPAANATGNYAYKYLQRTGRNRFSERKTPLDAKTLTGMYNREYAEIANLERFLQSKTSTVGGIREVQYSVKQTFKQRYGIDVSNKAVNDVLVNHFKFLTHSIGSDVAVAVLKAVGASNATKDEVLNKLSKLSEQERVNLRDMPVEDVFKELDLPFNAKFLISDKPTKNPFR